MKLMIAVIQAEDALETTDVLTHAGYRVTKISTVGGWLRKANVTLLIGLSDNQVWHATKLLQRVAGKRAKTVLSQGEPMVGLVPEEMNVEVGGVTLFVLDVEQQATL